MKKIKTCHFRGAKITACDNWIRWGRKKLDYIKGFTSDVCVQLFATKDCVVWKGKKETWELIYMGGKMGFTLFSPNYGGRCM